MATLDPTDRKTFEERLPVIEEKINNRRKNWTLTKIDFDDVKQLLLIRVWKKIHLFDPTKSPFEHWLNRLLTNILRNIRRDNFMKYARPCIKDGGCSYNLGDNLCGYTSNGIQCKLCPLYAQWKERKESEYNIKSSVSIEHHTEEVNNIQSDFLNIDEKKKVIDKKMMELLTPWERHVYRLLYIEHLTPLKASIKLKKIASTKRRSIQPTDAVEYQAVLRETKRMKEMMIEIIKGDDLI